VTDEELDLEQYDFSQMDNPSPNQICNFTGFICSGLADTQGDICKDFTEKQVVLELCQPKIKISKARGLYVLASLPKEVPKKASDN